jgi:CheY-like chemotaxis protein
MKLLIVEDDPSLRKVLVEFVQGKISDAEVIEADNLDDAVRLLHPTADCGLSTVDAILTDGTFPTWAERTLPRPWNHPAPNWIALAGWAEKRHIPLVVLTGAGEVAEHARRVGVPVFMKPMEVHRAIACLRALVVPKAVRENPMVPDVNHENERIGPVADATGEP